MSKKTQQESHAKRRFKERFGISFTKHMHDEFMFQIRHSQAELLEKQSNRVSKFRVKYKEEHYTIIYDRERKTIVTVLPKSADQQNGSAQLVG